MRVWNYSVEYFLKVFFTLKYIKIIFLNLFFIFYINILKLSENTENILI
jgi:hypothetical protein